ncbi:MAG: tol-pal system protein YbgF [Pseudomonadota bacterium]
MAANRLKLLGICCLLGGTAMVGPVSATAQAIDAGTIDIESRLAAAEAQVEQLGEVLGVPIQLAQAVPENYAAQVELRLGQLEQSLRQLLGQVEQLQFQQRSLSDQLQRALNDIEFRLTELEGGDTSAILGGTSAPAPAPAPSPTPPAPTPLADAGGASPNVGPSAPATTGGTLGSLSVAPGTEGAVPGSDDASRAYNAAFALVEAGDYAAAQRSLTSFVNQYSTHPLASNAQYWLGETHFAQGQFEAAANAFAQGYQRFPTGSKAMDSLFNLGVSLSALGRISDACNAYQQFLIRYPAAPQTMAERARGELVRLQCG